MFHQCVRSIVPCSWRYSPGSLRTYRVAWTRLSSVWLGPRRAALQLSFSPFRLHLGQATRKSSPKCTKCTDMAACIVLHAIHAPRHCPFVRQPWWIVCANNACRLPWAARVHERWKGESLAAKSWFIPARTLSSSREPCCATEIRGNDWGVWREEAYSASCHAHDWR